MQQEIYAAIVTKLLDDCVSTTVKLEQEPNNASFLRDAIDARQRFDMHHKNVFKALNAVREYDLTREYLQNF